MNIHNTNNNYLTQENNKTESEKLEDILSSIRNMIDTKEYQDFADDDDLNLDHEVLELTKVADNNDDACNKKNPHANNSILSENIANQSSNLINEFSQKIQNNNITYDDKPMDNAVIQLIQPLLKEWLDNNLPRIIEKIVSDEIKRLVPKK